MKKAIVLFVTVTFTVISSFAQDCIFYYPKTKGAVLEYKTYDKKNALTGISRHKVMDVTQSGNSISATVEIETFDKKEKSLGKSDINVKCENGVYYLDMKSFISPATLEGYKDMDVTFESDNLQLPANLNVGDMLKDASLKMTVSNAGMKIITITTTITNRKVEAKEKITTEAGTFDCYKISSLVTSKSFMTLKINSTEWYSKEVGLIKSESYTNGNLSGRTILTSIK